VVGTLASLASKGESGVESNADDGKVDAAPPPPDDAKPSMPKAPPVRRDAPADRAPPPRVVPPAPTGTLEPRRGWLQLAARLGPGFDRGAWRLGGELSARVRVSSGVHGSLGAGYAQTVARVDDLRGRWLSAFAGPALVLGDTVTGAFAVEGLLQHLDLSVPAGSGGSPTDGGRWLGGVRLAASATWWVAPDFGLAASATGKWLGGTTDARVRGQVVATEQPLGYSIGAGAAYGF
jgi:hypothetical protein